MLELHTLRLQAQRMLWVVGLAAAAVLLSTPSARAELAIAADFEGLAPIEIDDVKTAPCFGIRLGFQLRLPLFALTPELGYKWASFKNGAVINRGIAGARLSIGEIFRFGVSAHVGFGHRSEEYQAVEHSNTGMS